MTGDKKQALGLDSLSGVLTDGNITSKPWSLQEGVQYRLVEYTGWLGTQVGLSTKGIKEVRSPLSPLTSAGHPVPLQLSPPSS